MPDVHRSNHEQSSTLRGDPVTLAPLTMDQPVDTISAIKPDDVKKIASKSGKGKKK